MEKINPFIVAILTSLFALSACTTVGPDYKAPKAVNIDLPQTGILLDTTVNLSDLSWRQYYRQPELQQLISKALSHNIDLRIARTSVEQSARVHRLSEIALLPSLGGEFTGERESASGLTSSSPSIDNEFNLTASASWEIDFWGKLTRASEASLASLQASEAQLYAAKISLIAQTATLYYNLQDINYQVALTKSNIEARRKSKHIADLRHKQGVISGLDVRQAEVSLAQERIKLPSLQRKQNQLMFQLSLLIGELPKKQEIGKRQDVKATLGALPVGLPADLLKRRPDIIAAERKVEVASAGIGIAKADYFPNIMLTADIGNRSADLTDILSSAGRRWIIEANVNMPLWDWGRVDLNVETAEANYQVALLKYQQAVLVAFSEVASSLEDYKDAFTVFDLRKSLLTATKENLRIADLRYANGVISYLDVLDAQRNHATAEQELSSAIKAKQLAMVNLYRSLGGGWQKQSVKQSLTSNH